VESRWARVGRGTIAAAVATFVAALSHAIGGDAPPSWFGVAASFVLSLSVCTALAGRSLSWLRLAASVAVSQVLFHTLFSGPAVPTMSPGHGHDAAAMTMPAMEAHDDRMILAHVLAGVLTLLALRFGERAFWSVADSARLVVERLLPGAVTLGAAPARVLLPAARSALAPRTIHVPSTHRHRGPPLQFASI
jgi:hypothetical protein